MKAVKNNPYAYGWMVYKHVEGKDTGVLDKDGKKVLDHPTIRIYNATADDPPLALSISGEQYVFQTNPPEPDSDPDLPAGTRFWSPISSQELEYLLEVEREKRKEAGYFSSRQHERGWIRNQRKVLRNRNVIRTVTEETDGNDI